MPRKKKSLCPGCDLPFTAKTIKHHAITACNRTQLAYWERHQVDTQQ